MRDPTITRAEDRMPSHEFFERTWLRRVGSSTPGRCAVCRCELISGVAQAWQHQVQEGYEYRYEFTCVSRYCRERVEAQTRVKIHTSVI